LSYRGPRATLDDSSVRGRRRAKTHQPLDTSGRMVARVARTTLEGTTVIRYAVVLAVGYVMGTRAGRRRYEQIVSAYKAVTGSPAAKIVIDAGRRRIANRVSPDRAMVTLTEIDTNTSVLQPQAPRA